MLRASRASAAATLAQIMNSSISRWLSSRLRGVIATTPPRSSSLTCRSGRSSSSVPRRARAAFRTS